MRRDTWTERVGAATAVLVLLMVMLPTGSAQAQEVDATASVGDFVWDDLDRDGIQDPDEPGLSGITVALYDATGLRVGLTRTDATGRYLFDNLAPGDYTALFAAVVIGRSFTTQDVGDDDEVDSDVDRFSSRTEVFSLEAGDVHLSIDAGLAPSVPVPPLGPAGTIGDRVWEDVDRDGIQDVDEPGVAGVELLLRDGDGDVITSTTSDGVGMYRFEGLTAGEYFVEAVLPGGFEFTWGLAGDDRSVDSNVDEYGPYGPWARVELSQEEQGDATIDIGMSRIRQSGSFAGVVYEDLDGDGVRGPDEPGVAGVGVELFAYDGQFSVGSIESDTDGRYQFDVVREGAYAINFYTAARVFTAVFVGDDRSVDSDVIRYFDGFGSTDQVHSDGLSAQDGIDAGVLPFAAAGDVNCDGVSNIVDALLIAQYTVRVGDVVSHCGDFGPGKIVLRRGDVDLNRRTDLIDALFLARCEAGLPNDFCPAAAG